MTNLEQNGVVVNITARSIYNVNLLLDRGYTGHEHLFIAGLIHMNGRLYDPLMHRFLQPDNYVQDPSNTQNYNRYGYVLNNPLKYSDPTGEEFVTAVAIAVFAAAATYTISALVGPPVFSWCGFMKTVTMAFVSSFITFGIGEGVSTITNFWTKTAVSALARGTVQGGLSEMQGGKFINGFASGALSSVAASLWQGDATHKGISGALRLKGDAGTILFGAISGGVGSHLTGGNFWQGAVTGGIVAGLNHVAHAMTQPRTTVAGIYGAGSEDGSGNPDLEKLVEGEGGTMFSSTTPFGEGDDEIISFLKAAYDKGNLLKIYGHSRGGAAAVRIANKLGEMNINVFEIRLYDPVSLGGDFVFTHQNVGHVNNYYQRNSTMKLYGIPTWNLDNPFVGSPVYSKYSSTTINNINLTGVYYKPGVLISHLNITDYAIKNYKL